MTKTTSQNGNAEITLLKSELDRCKKISRKRHCHKQDPTTRAYLRLADAFLRNNELDKAIQTYRDTVRGCSCSYCDRIGEYVSKETESLQGSNFTNSMPSSSSILASRAHQGIGKAHELSGDLEMAALAYHSSLECMGINAYTINGINDYSALDVAETLHRLGHVCRLNHQYKRAILYLAYAFSMRKEILGNESHLTVQSLQEISITYYELGQPVEASKMLSEIRIGQKNCSSASDSDSDNQMSFTAPAA